MRFEDIPIAVISLDRRPDRWELFRERAQVAGILDKAEKLSAVDAKGFVAHEHPGISLMTAYNIKNKVRRSHQEIDQGGAIGCSLSHFKAWESLLDSSAPALIIFEDDADVPKDFVPRMKRLLSELPAEWDMVTFYNTIYLSGVGSCKALSSDKPWSACFNLMGSHAYMLSRRGAQRLMSRAYPIEMHIDAYMAFMARMKHITMLWNPVMQVEQAYDDTDIPHGKQRILDVPSNMEKHGIVALNEASIVGIMAMAAVVGGMVALAYVVKKRGVK